MPSRTRRIRGSTLFQGQTLRSIGGAGITKLQRNRGGRNLGLATANVEIMPMNVATPLQLNASLNGAVQPLHHTNINFKTHRYLIGSYNSRLNNARKRASLTHAIAPKRHVFAKTRKNRRTRK
jgi:hypothetical protein